jgi:hypothetical protein
MRSLWLTAFASVVVLSTPANAWSDLDRMTLSTALGDILSSERHADSLTRRRP